MQCSHSSSPGMFHGDDNDGDDDEKSQTKTNAASITLHHMRKVI